MEKTRVPFGEKYWFINCFGEVVSTLEGGIIDNAKRYEIGNYFTTEEEAEDMARKLRAVLNGAEVIKMPSEEEIYDKAFNISRNPIDPNIGYAMCCEMAEWFISKCIK